MTRRGIVPAVLLCVLVMLAFTGLSHNEFVPYDDDRYVTANPAVRAGLTAAGLRWAFTSVGYASNWHPLTWLSHMADVSLFGLDPGRQHLVNLLLHLAACLLLLHLLRSVTDAPWRSFFVAALVAVHPLRVESVAWVAQRKDVLGFLFGMLCLVGWHAWLRIPGSRRKYTLVVAAYLAALMSKPTYVMLPLLMLVLAWWPLGVRWRHDATPSRVRVPRAISGTSWLLVPALAAAVLTLLAQRAGGGLLERAAPPLGMRLANALLSIVSYLGKQVQPRELAVFYPFPSAIAASTLVAASLVVAGVFAVSLLSRRRHPYVAAGWLWYLAALLPTLGLVPVGAQAMADRYTYVPSVGLAIACVWLTADLTRPRTLARRAAASGGVALILALIPITRAQVTVWRNGTSLFTHALRVTRDNWQIQHEYGALLFNDKRYPEAEKHFREALRLQPDHVLARYNLAGTLFRQGEPAAAAAEYRQAIRLRPDFAAAHFRLARTLVYRGDLAGALFEYEETLRLQPDHAAAAAGRREARAALFPNR